MIVHFSRFRPFGHNVPGEPIARRLYYAARDAIGFEANYGGDAGMDAKLFADAMIQASALLLVMKAKAELEPLSTSQLLTMHERENGIVPIPGTSQRERQEFLALLKSMNVDGHLSTIRSTLEQFLGDDLVGHRTFLISETGPEERNPNPRGNQSTWETPLHVVKTRVPIAHKNVPMRVAVDFVGGDRERYSVGQKVVADAGRYERSEVVTVLTADAISITAKFQKPHDVGAMIVGGHHPRNWSNKRMHIIMLRNGKANDYVLRGQIHILMRRLAHATARWEIVEEEASRESGPFVLGESLMGSTMIGATAL